VPETIPHVAAASLGVILVAFLIAASSIFPLAAHASSLVAERPGCCLPYIWRPASRGSLDIPPRGVLVDEGPVQETADDKPLSLMPPDDVIV
jgi:hypothetical protein